MNIRIGLHTITIALCWVLPMHIFLADISRNGASRETWGSTANQIADLCLGIPCGYVLATPLALGVIIEVTKRLPSKG